MELIKNAAAAKVAEKLEDLADLAGNIAGWLDVLEMALYFADERRGEDITKPGAAAARMLAEHVKRIQLDLLEVYSMMQTA